MRRVRHRATRLPSDSGHLVMREHTVELRLSQPFLSLLATITGDITRAQSCVVPFPPRVLVVVVPPSMTRHDLEPVASPHHLSVRTAHAFTVGTPLSPATHDLDLAHTPWAAPVGRHGRGSTLPHSPATVPAREHPPIAHAPMDMYARCPIAVALGTWPFALPQTSTCTAPGTLARMAVHQHATAEAFL